MLFLIGGIDYLPAEISLIFERSLENQTKCGEFSIIQDGLDEGQETFFLSLSQDNEVKIPGNITVNIDACKQGGKCRNAWHYNNIEAEVTLVFSNRYNPD